MYSEVNASVSLTWMLRNTLKTSGVVSVNKQSQFQIIRFSILTIFLKSHLFELKQSK